MSNVTVKRKYQSRVVPMYDMKHGDIGVVVDKTMSNYAGVVVKAFISFTGNVISVVALDSRNLFWSSDNPGRGNGVLVEIYEPGTEVTITT